MVIRLVLLIILLLFHCVNLGVRPPHHDESVNGWFVDGIFNKGFYDYDPGNYHGPLYFYLLAFFRGIFGRSIEVLRWPTLILGWAVTFTPFLFRKWLSERGAWIAAFFLAVSPAMVFFSRYAIHEMGFALSCILFFYYWLKAREGDWSKDTVIGLGLTLGSTACLKENFILFVAVLFIAEACLKVYEKRFDFKPTSAGLKGSLVATGIGFVLVCIFYSGFFQDPNGIPDFFRAFYFWSETGSKGNGHQKPFYYWLILMSKFEWMAMLGLLLTPLALKRVSRELRLVSVVSFGMFLAYSIVSYKTPWCVLSFYWGQILIAAYWLSRWMNKPGIKLPLMGAILVGYGVSSWQTYDVAYENPDQENHLYIYGQTYRDFMPPLNEILAKAKANPELYNSLRIQVISQFTWPLPYILGEFKSVAFHTDTNPPTVLDAPYVLIDENLMSKYESRLSGSYTREVVRARQWASSMVILRRQ